MGPGVCKIELELGVCKVVHSCCAGVNRVSEGCISMMLVFCKVYQLVCGRC